MRPGLLMSSLALPVPHGFKEIDRPFPDVRRFVSLGGLRVIAAKEDHGGQRILHVSVSLPSSLPTWADLKHVKEQFIGDCFAFQVLPPQAEYINVNPNVLHLWALADGSDVFRGARVSPARCQTCGPVYGGRGGRDAC